jgi:fructose-1,6-bisphosphatase II
MGVISHDVRSGSKPDRNLALELVRVTESAALAASRWIGRGDKLAADGAAVDAMRIPLEGTTLTARGFGGALAVIALSERGTMFDPGPCVYMEKLAAASEFKDLLTFDEPIGEVIRKIGERKGGGPEDVTLTILDRPRHEEVVKEVRESGATIRFITDGDVQAALLAVSDDTGIDLLWGIGGTPEGVLAAAAIKCLGGEIIGKLWPRNDEERQAAIDAGYDLDRVLTADDLVSGDDVFFAATGVTDGDLLDGVRRHKGWASTESLVMRSRSGTVRKIGARHDRAKLREVTGGLFG